MAIVEGSRKVILPENIEALEAGRILKAYDLTNDPAETDELLSAGATWPMALAEKHAEVGVHFLTPVLEAGQGSLSPEARELLQKLGYAGRD